MVLNFEQDTGLVQKIAHMTYITHEDPDEPVGPELPDGVVLYIRIIKETGTDIASKITNLYYLLGDFDDLENDVNIEAGDEQYFEDKIQEYVLSRVQNSEEMIANRNPIYGVIPLSQEIIDKYDALIEAS